ncbi:MAG: hypothetical protein IJQ31_13945 [Thermoguttaceae bacterium]|nr:hypothetical protein [Thermoguttaceae bacterium]
MISVRRVLIGDKKNSLRSLRPLRPKNQNLSRKERKGRKENKKKNPIRFICVDLQNLRSLCGFGRFFKDGASRTRRAGNRLFRFDQNFPEAPCNFPRDVYN